MRDYGGGGRLCFRRYGAVLIDQHLLTKIWLLLINTLYVCFDRLNWTRIEKFAFNIT